MSALAPANLLLRFLLELAALAALGYWGFATHDGLAAKLGFGLGAPLAAALVWGFAVSPKRRVQPPPAIHVALQALVFGSAAIALAAADHPTLGAALFAVGAINWLLMRAWNQLS